MTVLMDGPHIVERSRFHNQIVQFLLILHHEKMPRAISCVTDQRREYAQREQRRRRGSE